MKKYLNKNNIILTILILIILAGIITLFIAGFNKGIEYKAGTRIEIYIPKGFEKQDILNIAKESFNTEEISVLEVEKLNQVAGIKITEYTEDELKDFKSKIAEKYEMEEENLELHEITVPSTKIGTIMEPYILPILLITVLSLIYTGIKNFKSSGMLIKLFKILMKLVLVLGVYFSIILIFRVSFSMFTMPIALLVYIICLLIIVDKE